MFLIARSLYCGVYFFSFLYTELNMFIICFFTLPARDLKLIIDMMESYNKPTVRTTKITCDSKPPRCGYIYV